MVAVNNISYHVGERTIFSEASLHIKPKDRIGLVGLNGTGKTTLLKMINGEIRPDDGEITRSKECTIGYLDQDMLSFESNSSILAIAMEAFQEAVKIEQSIEVLLEKISTDYSEKDVHKLTELQSKYEAIGGYALQSRAEEILEGIGFRTEDLHRPLSTFSGGWRMRAVLARLLLSKPALLMLDEPTNHLDLPSILWLEQYLSNYPGAIIVVSHDKRFLDNIATSIVEVRSQDLIGYSGNYSFYLEEKKLRMEVLKNAFQNQQQKIKQDERFIERFRAKSTKARQVQSRVKALEKMDRIDEIEEEEVTFSVSFKPYIKSGRHVIQLIGASKHYGDNCIFDAVDIAVERGDKIALTGANGLGKSTLLRIIAGTENHGGKRTEGHNVISALYAQHQVEALTLDNEVLGELKQTGTTKTEQELRTLLGSFLFRGDDVFKKIKVLSGGEKSRVALAKTLISGANFLILDEPTNHLDMLSVQVLIEALRQYEGTFVAVSHDRYFMQEVANKIWYIENKTVKEYPGTLQEYMYWKKRREAPSASKPASAKKAQKKSVAKDKRNRKDIPREIKDKQKHLKEVEDRILELEHQKDKLEKQMASPEYYADHMKLAEANNLRDEIVRKLNQENASWEVLVDEINMLEEEE
jgi:ATP-binding cassette subfamily F protein 3